jgi:hypothetical protein
VITMAPKEPRSSAPPGSRTAPGRSVKEQGSGVPQVLVPEVTPGERARTTFKAAGRSLMPPLRDSSRRPTAVRTSRGSEPSIALTGPMNVLVRISTRAGDESLTYVHEFISHYAGQRYRQAVAESVRLAAFELLENGIAYGSISSPVVIELAEQGPWVLLRVSNDAIEARAGRLKAQLDKLSADAQATYLDQVRRSVGSPGRALLGLARVAHEGGMRLDAETTNGRVVVTAYRRS